MDFQEAKLHKQKLDEINQEHSAKLNSFEREVNGLTPDHVRETDEWKKAKQDFDRSFAELRKFNGWYVKTFLKRKSNR